MCLVSLLDMEYILGVQSNDGREHRAKAGTQVPMTSPANTTNTGDTGTGEPVEPTVSSSEGFGAGDGAP